MRGVEILEFRKQPNKHEWNNQHNKNFVVFLQIGQREAFIVTECVEQWDRY